MADRPRKGVKLTPAEVDKIRSLPLSPTVLALRFGVSRAMVSYIKSGKCWGKETDQ